MSWVAQLADKAKEPFEYYLENDLYVTEYKVDGYRMILEFDGDEVFFYNRSGAPMSKRVNDALQEQFDAVSIKINKPFVLDGELLGSPNAKQIYVAWDMLKYGDENLMHYEWADRRAHLETYLPNKGLVSFVEVARNTTAKRRMYQEARKDGREGLIAKPIHAAYRPGERKDWIKLKFNDNVATLKVGRKMPSFELYARYTGGNIAKDVTSDSHVYVGTCAKPADVPFPKQGSFVEVSYLDLVDNLVQPVYLGERDDKDQADDVKSLHKRNNVFDGGKP
jgi:ATP-dependent DNA ligase